MSNQPCRTLNTVLAAGAVGGAMEVLWIGLIAVLLGIQSSEVARAVTATVVPASAGSTMAPWLGIAIHFSLSLALALVLAGTLLKKLRGAALLVASVAALGAVWAFNFFVLLPAINPAFVLMLPYPVTLVSKLLFGLAMGLVLDHGRVHAVSD